MISFQYLPITSVLACAHTLPALCTEWIHGNLLEALVLAERTALSTTDDNIAALMLQSCGDLNLVSGNAEEAEEWYRKSIKRLKRSAEIDTLSCRATGFKALFQNRLESAALCFYRLAKEATSSNMRMEGFVWLALILREVGLGKAAQQALEHMSALAADLEQDNWRHLSKTIAYDFAVHSHIYDSQYIKDHIYRNSFVDHAAGPLPLAPLKCVEGTRNDSHALIAMRENQIRQLMLLANGQITELSHFQPALHWGGKHTTYTLRTTTALEIALAALAARSVNVANMMMSSVAHLTPPTGLEHSSGVTSSQLEHVYCLSKLRVQQGHTEESIALYRKYAMAATRAIRGNYPIVRRFAEEPLTSHTVIRDDVSARLPARYRRAYQYMLAHIQHADLSVQEIAAAIGVTERALQMAFKAYLGMTPREVLRRHRMEKIRDELQHRVGDDGPIMEVAMKFGVQNRTSLVTGYKKYFYESPSETENLSQLA